MPRFRGLELSSPDALDGPRRRRRLLRARARQPRPTSPHRRLVSVRPRIPARARLRPRAAGSRSVNPRRQPVLCLPSEEARRTHGTHRRLCPPLRHQHRLALRPRVPGDAAGESARREDWRPRSRAYRVAGGTARDAVLRHYRTRRRLRRRKRPQGHSAGGSPLDAGRNRAGVHLARFSLPDLRAA